MKAECASCISWQLKSSPMARQGLAPCALKARWDYLPPSGTCDAHKPLEQTAIGARVLWLGRIDQKHERKA